MKLYKHLPLVFGHFAIMFFAFKALRDHDYAFNMMKNIGKMANLYQNQWIAENRWLLTNSILVTLLLSPLALMRGFWFMKYLTSTAFCLLGITKYMSYSSSREVLPDFYLAMTAAFYLLHS